MDLEFINESVNYFNNSGLVYLTLTALLFPFVLLGESCLYSDETARKMGWKDRKSSIKATWAWIAQMDIFDNFRFVIDKSYAKRYMEKYGPILNKYTRIPPID